MKKILCITAALVALGICSTEARGQNTQALTDMYRYVATDGTERLAAWAETGLDYEAANYYCAGVLLTLYKDYSDGTSEEISHTGASSCYTSELYARTEVDFPYDANVEYRIEAHHSADPIYIMPGSGSLNDYYNYSIYQDPMFGDVVWYPLYYSFIGTGPERPSAGSIILGITTAYWTAGALAGLPDHLKVVSDNTVTLDCGQLERKWKFKVVDSNGRNVGRIPIKEHFPGTIVSSCTGATITPTGCSSNHSYNNGYTDTVRSWCPPPTGQCGFEIRYNEWRWCPRDRPQLTLATMLYEVYSNGIKLNGSLRFSAGLHIY